jgi:hypothetical protein
MHRTQIILEEWQYQTLRARAEQEGRSISELVRNLLAKALTQSPPRKGRIKAIEGIGEDRSAYGRAHDRLLYRRKMEN